METLKSIINEHLFLKSMIPQFRDLLADGAVETEFKPDEVIFRQGGYADKFYLIQKGKVALESHEPGNGDISVQTIGAGEVLGWSWLFPPFVWHFQARALEPTQAIAFNGAHLLVACEANHDLGYDVMKRMSQILIQRLQATRKQLVALHTRRGQPGS